jgi:hypothetical protein
MIKTNKLVSDLPERCPKWVVASDWFGVTPMNQTKLRSPSRVPGPARGPVLGPGLQTRPRPRPRIWLPASDRASRVAASDPALWPGPRTRALATERLDLRRQQRSVDQRAGAGLWLRGGNGLSDEFFHYAGDIGVATRSPWSGPPVRPDKSCADFPALIRSGAAAVSCRRRG